MEERRSIWIESKSFIFELDKGGNFFWLRIVERGRQYMRSMSLGQNDTRWVVKSMDETTYFLCNNPTPLEISEKGTMHS